MNAAMNGKTNLVGAQSEECESVRSQRNGGLKVELGRGRNEEVGSVDGRDPRQHREIPKSDSDFIQRSPPSPEPTQRQSPRRFPPLLRPLNSRLDSGLPLAEPEKLRNRQARRSSTSPTSCSTSSFAFEYEKNFSPTACLGLPLNVTPSTG